MIAECCECLGECLLASISYNTIEEPYYWTLQTGQTLPHVPPSEVAMSQNEMQGSLLAEQNEK